MLTGADNAAALQSRFCSLGVQDLLVGSRSAPRQM